jgi:hypothetical protein
MVPFRIVGQSPQYDAKPLELLPTPLLNFKHFFGE